METMNRNVLFGLTYLIGIIMPLIVVFGYKNPDDEVKFHASQALTFNILVVACGILSYIGVIGGIFGLLQALIGLATFIIAIMAFANKFVTISFLSGLTETVQKALFKQNTAV